MKIFTRSLLFIVCWLLQANVFAQPVANFTATPLAGCAPHVVQFTSTSTGNPTSYFWTFGNTSTSVLPNPSTSYLTPGTYTVTLTVTNANGSNTKTEVNYITVYSSPTVSFTVNDTAGCPPLPVQFTNTTNLQVPGPGTYNWNFGDASPFSNVQSPAHTYTLPGYYTVTLTATNSANCVTSQSFLNYIHVRTPPNADFTGSPTNYCGVPSTVNFTSTVTGAAPLVYAWDFGDGGTGSGANPTHTYTTSGTYTVKMIVTDPLGCQDTVEKLNYITAGSTVAAFTTSNACEGAPTQFTNGSVNATSVLWDFGDNTPTSTVTSPTHIFASAGTYNVTLVIFNSPCSDTVTVPVTINPKPILDFTFTPAHPCPAPQTQQFTNLSTGATIFAWDFDDGGTSTATNPTHTYTVNDTFLVKLTAITALGCVDTLSKRDTVHNMLLNISPKPRSGCVPLTIKFKSALNTTTPQLLHGYPYPVVSYLWDFGDGSPTSTLDTPSHIYTVQGSYKVKLTVTTINGCTITDSTYVSAGDRPTASFIGAPDTVCVNDAVHFINTSTDTTVFTSYTWFMGDAGQLNSKNATYVYQLSGFYNVTLIADNFGCIDSFSVDSASVVLPPTSLWMPSYSCDSPLKVQFMNSSIQPTSVIWDFGDGSPTSNVMSPVHYYSALGNYTASLITFNSTAGCSDTLIRPIQLIDPVLSFTTPDTAICRWDSIVFNPGYPGSGVPQPKFIWWIDNILPPAIGDTTAGPWGHKFNQRGIYTIHVRSRDIHDCWDTVTRTNYILVAKPTATFSGTPLVGCTPLNVKFTENSTNVPGAFSVSRFWDFGNGNTSTVTTDTTTTTYNTGGIFNVQLIVTDNVGCSDTLTKNNYVDARKPIPSFTVSSPNSCIGTQLLFNNNSTGVSLSAFWDFGDGTTSTQYSPVKTYNQVGSYTVKLVVTDPIGCKDSVTLVGYINITKPTAAFTMSDTMAICPPLNVVFTNSSTGTAPLTYAWDFGNSTNSIIQSPTAAYPTPGIYNISLVVADAAGCTDTAYSVANVLGYAGGLSYTPLKGCWPLTVNFRSTLYNVPSIVWDFSDGVTVPLSGVDTIIHIYQTPGAYLPKLILSDNTGCQNSSLGLDTIKVDGILPGFITSPPCVNTPVVFTDTSFSFFSPVNAWYWSFDNGVQTSTSSSPTMTYPTAGTYTVYLKSTNSEGCSDSITRTVTIFDLPTITAYGDTTICKGDAAQIGAGGGISYTWLPANTLSCGNCPAPSASPTATTKYITTGTDINGCKNTDSVIVAVQYVTTSNVDDGGGICIDSIFQLRAFGAQRYEWKPAQTLNDSSIANPIASPREFTVYTVYAWEGSCPPDSHKVAVTVFTKPIVDAGSDQTIVAGSAAMLAATGTNLWSFIWTPAATLSCETCSNPEARPKIATQYKVTAMSDRGCKNSDSVTVHILCDNSQLFIPNTFTPNNDGQNDVFYPRGEGLKSITSFRVYNRWGEIVFERNGTQLNDASGGWDGTKKGKELSPDTYVYIVDGVCDTGEPISWKGDVTLIR